MCIRDRPKTTRRGGRFCFSSSPSATAPTNPRTNQCRDFFWVQKKPLRLRCASFGVSENTETRNPLIIDQPCPKDKRKYLMIFPPPAHPEKRRRKPTRSAHDHITPSPNSCEGQLLFASLKPTNQPRAAHSAIQNFARLLVRFKCRSQIGERAKLQRTPPQVVPQW